MQANVPKRRFRPISLVHNLFVKAISCGLLNDVFGIDSVSILLLNFV